MPVRKPVVFGFADCLQLGRWDSVILGPTAEIGIACDPRVGSKDRTIIIRDNGCTSDCLKKSHVQYPHFSELVEAEMTFVRLWVRASPSRIASVADNLDLPGVFGSSDHSHARWRDADYMPAFAALIGELLWMRLNRIIQAHTDKSYITLFPLK